MGNSCKERQRSFPRNDQLITGIFDLTLTRRIDEQFDAQLLNKPESAILAIYRPKLQRFGA